MDDSAALARGWQLGMRVGRRRGARFGAGGGGVENACAPVLHGTPCRPTALVPGACGLLCKACATH